MFREFEKDTEKETLIHCRQGLTSPTQVKLGVFFMFREFEKDTEKETPEVLFRTVCVSRVRKSLK